VVIEGEAGIGKTRLLGEALQDARGRGFQVAAGTRAGGPVPHRHRVPARLDRPAGRDQGQRPAHVRLLRPGPQSGVAHAIGLLVLGLSGSRICAMTRFDNSVLARFGLPRTLPD
jgi:hypothetical protein